MKKNTNIRRSSSSSPRRRRPEHNQVSLVNTSSYLLKKERQLETKKLLKSHQYRKQARKIAAKKDMIPTSNLQFYQKQQIKKQYAKIAFTKEEKKNLVDLAEKLEWEIKQKEEVKPKKEVLRREKKKGEISARDRPKRREDVLVQKRNKVLIRKVKIKKNTVINQKKQDKTNATQDGKRIETNRVIKDNLNIYLKPDFTNSIYNSEKIAKEVIVNDNEDEEQNPALEALDEGSKFIQNSLQRRKFREQKRRKAKKVESRSRKSQIQKKKDGRHFRKEPVNSSSFKPSNAYRQEGKKNSWQKRQFKKRYQQAKRSEETKTATVGTIDYLKKIGGKVTNFFKENQKLYLTLAVFLICLLLLMSMVGSCSTTFFQNVVTYAATSYLSEDEAIRLADLYYSKLEADLQEKIDQIETEYPDHEEYRYDLGEIGHDPFVLISYLSAKYEVFTYEEVSSELDELFALQYQFNTESIDGIQTQTKMVTVGESLGTVVTTGYCNCSICCGKWAGGPTASGVMPTAKHTLAVDATEPFLPMGTKVIMNGVEYTVEDKGNFARKGPRFDIYFDSHQEALEHGVRNWEAYLADDNGNQQIEVTTTQEVNAFQVTLKSNDLEKICQSRLDELQQELYAVYKETKGNLQMFGSPFTFNWSTRIDSYYGYRKHPADGEMTMHNGLDIFAPLKTSVQSGMIGKVTKVGNNGSYGNYVIIKDDDGYELRYAFLFTTSVKEGDNVEIGAEIGKVGKGNNGSCLHLELLKNGARMNPIFYLEVGTETAISSGSTYYSEAASKLIAEAEKYLGTPYVWGGYAPGGFDCSGFVSYSLTHSGVKNTGRLTAQALYDSSTPIGEEDAQPGDLIFFTGTYHSSGPVSHVGIYLGEGQMIHCGDPIAYASIYTSYWKSHFYAFGRILD